MYIISTMKTLGLTLIFLCLFVLHVNADDTNQTTTATDVSKTSEVITIKDTSGLTKDELRQKASEADKAQKTPNALWKELAPQALHYDWIELTSGEWLKGKFKALYDKELEFDSKEFDLQSIDFHKIRQIRTYNVVSISIQAPQDQRSGFFSLQNTSIELSGILRLKENEVTIIQGSNTFSFTRDEVVSIAYGGERELQYWSGKVTLSLDVKKGNNDQLDYSAQASVQRRSPKTRLRFDYLGNLSQTNGIETASSTRLNEKFDLFVTPKFFVSPSTLEYFKDTYQNIAHRWTIGAAAGYTLIDRKNVEWDVSFGPAVVKTQYDTVAEDGELDHTSWAIQLGTIYEVELNKRTDLTCNYQFTAMDEKSGNYRHHTITKLENEITTWLDLDFTFVWDYLYEPTRDATGGTPDKNDYQLLVGLGIEF
ncbi:MAG: DUF481 domain-containing protein [Campylobacterota bacterium]|nr:DUF481 domain-containing protein [Campylobacterota bacterium]